MKHQEVTDPKKCMEKEFGDRACGWYENMKCTFRSGPGAGLGLFGPKSVILDAYCPIEENTRQWKAGIAKKEEELSKALKEGKNAGQLLRILEKQRHSKYTGPDTLALFIDRNKANEIAKQFLDLCKEIRWD